MDKALDNELIRRSQDALEHGTPVEFNLPIRNVNRTVGTMLGFKLTRRWGGKGLPDNTIRIQFTGRPARASARSSPEGSH